MGMVAVVSHGPWMGSRSSSWPRRPRSRRGGAFPGKHPLCARFAAAARAYTRLTPPRHVQAVAAATYVATVAIAVDTVTTT